ncbi:hypothetical protein B484DRAFT_444328, partial [Ochromonadaceae sp. CCMP2298]
MGDPLVGAPLRRPPPGWDLRAPQQSTRWAWGAEEPSSVERNVAPRIPPAYWLPRVLCLLLFCWVGVNAFCLFLLLVPLPLGRAVVALLRVPVCLRHDPLCFLLGCGVSFALVRGVLGGRGGVGRWLGSMPIRVVMRVTRLYLLRLAAHGCVGALLLGAVSPASLDLVSVLAKQGEGAPGYVLAVVSAAVGSMAGVGLGFGVSLGAMGIYVGMGVCVGLGAVGGWADLLPVEGAFTQGLFIDPSRALLLAQCVAVGAVITLSARHLVALQPVQAYLVAHPLPPDSHLCQLLDWASHAAHTLGEVRDGRDRGGVEEGTLDVVEFAYARPLCRHCCSGLMDVVLWAYLLSTMLWGSLNPPLGLVASCGRLSCLLYCAACVGALLLHPLKALLCALHAQVR